MVKFVQTTKYFHSRKPEHHHRDVTTHLAQQDPLEGGWSTIISTGTRLRSTIAGFLIEGVAGGARYLEDDQKYVNQVPNQEPGS